MDFRGFSVEIRDEKSDSHLLIPKHPMIQTPFRPASCTQQVVLMGDSVLDNFFW
jgi:hypothetical protein